MNTAVKKVAATIGAAIPVVVCLLCIWSVLFCHPGALSAQTTVDETPPSQKEAIQPPAFIGLGDLLSKTTELSDRANELEPRLIALFDETIAEKKLDELKSSVLEIAIRIKQLKSMDVFNLEQLNEIKSDLRKRKAELKKFMEAVTESLTNVETLEKDWREETKRLNEWKNLLEDASLKDVKTVMARGQQTVKKALALISRKLKTLVAAEQKASDIQDKIRPIAEEIDQLLAKSQRDIFTFSGPPLYSLAFFSQFDAGLGEAMRKGIAAAAWPSKLFVKRNIWLLLFQLLAVIVIPAAIYRYKQKLTVSDGLRFLTNRPWASGIFISLFTLSCLYESSPANWSAFLWIAGSIAVARTVRVFLTDVWKKWLIYGLATLFTALQIFIVFGLPAPLLRLFLFALSAIGLLLCLWRSMVRTRRGGALGYTLVLRMGAVVFCAILVAEFLGYSRLAQHTMGAALKTVFLVIAFWMLSSTISGLIALLVQGDFLQRIRLVRIRTYVIIAKADTVVKLLLAVVFFFVILVTWKPSLHPGDALHAFLGLGVTVGDWRLSIGVVVGAAVLFYGSLLASRTVQAILKEEVFPRRQVELGVRISIARLIHYALISVGFLMALKALGFNLQNVTILGGALGIGIGFGLQAIVNNFVSGLILLFERPIKVGDVIQLDDQQAVIKKVGLRATIVETYDRAEIVVPNSDLISNKVVNWTLADRIRRLSMNIGVAYGSDVPKVMEILQACAETNADVMGEPAPQVLFMGFGESSLDFQLRVWISDTDKRPQVISALNLDIERRFRAAEVEIPFPQRDLHLRNIDGKAVSKIAEIFRESPHVPR